MRRVLLCGVLLVLLASCGGGISFRTQELHPAEPAPDFTLTDQRGQPFTLSAQTGQVVLLYFGFTSCPDICPTDLADLAALRQQLGSDADRVTVALITVDPQRDSAAQLERYLAQFDPQFVGLHGSPEELAPVYKDYGVYVAQRELPDSALGYTVDHSGYTYAIDKAGRWRLLFDHDELVEDMLSDVRELVREALPEA